MAIRGVGLLSIVAVLVASCGGGGAGSESPVGAAGADGGPGGPGSPGSPGAPGGTGAAVGGRAPAVPAGSFVLGESPEGLRVIELTDPAAPVITTLAGVSTVGVVSPTGAHAGVTKDGAPAMLDLTTKPPSVRPVPGEISVFDVGSRVAAVTGTTEGVIDTATGEVVARGCRVESFAPSGGWGWCQGAFLRIANGASPEPYDVAEHYLSGGDWSPKDDVFYGVFRPKKLDVDASKLVELRPGTAPREVLADLNVDAKGLSFADDTHLVVPEESLQMRVVTVGANPSSETVPLSGSSLTFTGGRGTGKYVVGSTSTGGSLPQSKGGWVDWTARPRASVQSFPSAGAGCLPLRGATSPRAWCEYGGSIYVYDMEAIANVVQAAGRVASVAPDEKAIVVCRFEGDGRCRRIDAETRAERPLTNDAYDGYRSAAFSTDAQAVALLMKTGGTVHVVDLRLADSKPGPIALTTVTRLITVGQRR